MPARLVPWVILFLAVPAPILAAGGLLWLVEQGGIWAFVAIAGPGALGILPALALRLLPHCRVWLGPEKRREAATDLPHHPPSGQLFEVVDYLTGEIIRVDAEGRRLDGGRRQG